MRILFIVEQYPPDINVAGVRVHEIVNTFSKHRNVNIQILVFSITKSNSLRKHARVSSNVETVRYERKYLPRRFYWSLLMNPFSLFFWAFFAMREVREYKPDLLFTTVPSYTPSIIAYFLLKVFKTPYCIDFRDDWVHTNVHDYAIKSLPWYGRLANRCTFRIFYPLFRRSCKQASLFSTVYESLIVDLEAMPATRQPVIHVPNGINVSELRQIQQGFDKEATLKKFNIPYSNDEKHIIYVGSLPGFYYHPEMLIPALKALINEGREINYILVGGGDPTEIAKQAKEAAGVEDRVFLLGEQDHKTVIELCLASDIAFYALDPEFPGAQCLLSVKVLEYVACKLPILCIAGKDATVSQLVEHEGIGISLDWKETAKIASSVQQLVDTKVFQANIERYYTSFIAEFSRESNNERLFQCISKRFFKS
jgi:glycosyltransferase involved in cell wall biosynthesis